LSDSADEAFEAAFVIARCEFGELDVVGGFGGCGGVFVEGSTELADRLAFLKEGAALVLSVQYPSRGVNLFSHSPA
jgi:hypothetical protein